MNEKTGEIFGEKEMENGGSKWEKIRWNEDKKICPFDAKKVCPVTGIPNLLSLLSQKRMP